MSDRATWHDATTEVFIHDCLEQVYTQERRATSFTRKGWKCIVATFNNKIGKGFNRKQLKNRFDILKKDLRTWDMLLNETGLGRDPNTGALDASDEWWHRKCQENPTYRKYRYAPLKYERELRIIFRDYATGDDSYCPLFRHTQTDEGEDDDVHRPTMDTDEGSGDSTDESVGADPVHSTRVTEELASFGLSSQSGRSGPSGLGSQGKRKRVE